MSSFFLQITELGLQLIGINLAVTAKSGCHRTLFCMIIHIFTTTATFVSGASLTQLSTVMASDCEGSGGRACQLSRICRRIVTTIVIPYIIGIVRLLRMLADIVVQLLRVLYLLMLTIGIVLGEVSIHLSHERIPIHAVTVKDRLIDFFLDIP